MKFNKGSHHLASSVVYLSFWGLSAFSIDFPKPFQGNFCQMQPAKDSCSHGLFMFLRAVMGAAFVQVPADLISFEGRLLEVELCAASLCCLWHWGIWVAPGALSNVSNPGRIVVVLFLGEFLAARLMFALMHIFAQLDVFCFPMPFSCCALAGLSSGFLPPPSGPSGLGQSSEREARIPQSLGMSLETLRGKCQVQLGCFLLYLDCVKEWDSTFPVWARSGVSTCDVQMAEEAWFSCEIKLWVSLVMWESPPIHSLEQTTCAVVIGCCDVCAQLVSVGRVYGFQAGMDGKLFHCLVLTPEKMASCPGKKMSFTGHSPSCCSRHLAGFCKPWLKAAFLLRAVLLINLGAKCFDERGGNLFHALLFLASLGAFQSHSKLLQLDKWRHWTA